MTHEHAEGRAAEISVTPVPASPDTAADSSRAARGPSTDLAVLERLNPADLEPLAGWIADADELVQWSGPALFTWPLTMEQLIEYAASAGDGSQRRIFKAAPGPGWRSPPPRFGSHSPAPDAPLGICELDQIDARHRSAKVCRVIVAPDWRGRGVATAMIRGLVRHAFQAHRLHRLTLNVYSFNESAIRCYERCGFRGEGLLRDTCRVSSGYWSTLVMGMLEDDLLSES